MCFDLDSSPPINKISGASVSHQDTVLTSADGTEFAAFIAEGGKENSPGIVVLPDVRGLYKFYEELALRFAESGYDAIAIDYFGRTAGVAKRDDDFDFMEHVAQTKVSQVIEDANAAIDKLQESSSSKSRSIFTVGFCYGGSSSWIQSTQSSVNGAIGFYGNPTRDSRDGTPGPIQRVSEFQSPILGLMGGDDPGIPVEEVEKFRSALNDANVQNEIIIYNNAPHSFFDRKYEEFKSESADAWDRVLSFINQHA